MSGALGEIARAIEEGDRVVDLGVDVEPSAFPDAALESGATVVGLSALLTAAMTGMAEVVAALDTRGLGGTIKTIVGGAPLNTALSAEIGADAYAPDATAAVERIRALTGVAS